MVFYSFILFTNGSLSLECTSSNVSFGKPYLSFETHSYFTSGWSFTWLPKHLYYNAMLWLCKSLIIEDRAVRFLSLYFLDCLGYTRYQIKADCIIVFLVSILLLSPRHHLKHFMNETLNSTEKSEYIL